jgi:collagenase-like PrtC family protease
MKLFNVPADFKKETIDEYARLHDKFPGSRVIETYGNITMGPNFGSGRVFTQLPKTDLLDLQQYADYSKKHGIEFSYTLNAPYLGNAEFTEEGVARIKEFLRDLDNIGIDSIIIALPSLFDLVQLSGLNMRIKASTICHITNANKARTYRKKGIDKIVVDESVHRDFATLKRIREAFGEKIELIVNTMCHRNCNYRAFHYNETGGDSVERFNEVGIDFFEHKCMLQRYDTPSELLKLGWIRPEDLHYYSAIGINYFKLQGRQHVATGGHLRTLEYYFKEDFDGNLMDLLDMFNDRYSFKVHLDNKKLDGFLKPYWEKENFCKNDCSQCKHCDNFAKKAIDLEAAGKIIDSAKEFYNQCDKFRNLVEAVHPDSAPSAEEADEELDFNM